MMLLSELLIAKNHQLPFFEEAKAVRRYFWCQPCIEKLRFLPYAIKRFIGGWPDRKAPMRANLAQFLDALKMLFFPSFNSERAELTSCP